jgi:hypothetical protein
LAGAGEGLSLARLFGANFFNSRHARRVMRMNGVLALRIGGFDFDDPFIGQTGIERLQPKRFGNPALLREGI